MGVPVEGKVRVQLNLKVEHQPAIRAVANFPDIVFPIMWVEEGVDELPPPIRRWVYLATTFADAAVPCISYGLILVGIVTLVTTLFRAYNNVVFTHEAIELGKRTVRRGSSFLLNGQHRLLNMKDSYILLNDEPLLPDSRIESGNDSMESWPRAFPRAAETARMIEQFCFFPKNARTDEKLEKVDISPRGEKSQLNFVLVRFAVVYDLRV